MIELLFLSKEDVKATDPSLPEVMDAIEMGLKAHGEKKVIMPAKDHCLKSPYGQFTDLISEGILRGEHIYGEIGEIVAGLEPGRTSEEERILFWHKGFAISDIVLGHLVYRKAREPGIGTVLAYYKEPRDM